MTTKWFKYSHIFPFKVRGEDNLEYDYLEPQNAHGKDISLCLVDMNTFILMGKEWFLLQRQNCPSRIRKSLGRPTTRHMSHARQCGVKARAQKACS